MQTVLNYISVNRLNISLWLKEGNSIKVYLKGKKKPEIFLVD